METKEDTSIWNFYFPSPKRKHFSWWETYIGLTDLDERQFSSCLGFLSTSQRKKWLDLTNGYLCKDSSQLCWAAGNLILAGFHHSYDFSTNFTSVCSSHAANERAALPFETWIYRYREFPRHGRLGHLPKEVLFIVGPLIIDWRILRNRTLSLNDTNKKSVDEAALLRIRVPNRKGHFLRKTNYCATDSHVWSEPNKFPLKSFVWCCFIERREVSQSYPKELCRWHIHLENRSIDFSAIVFLNLELIGGWMNVRQGGIIREFEKITARGHALQAVLGIPRWSTLLSMGRLNEVNVVYQEREEKHLYLRASLGLLRVLDERTNYKHFHCILWYLEWRPCCSKTEGPASTFHHCQFGDFLLLSELLLFLRPKEALNEFRYHQHHFQSTCLVSL